jgi:hypothetical protein
MTCNVQKCLEVLVACVEFCECSLIPSYGGIAGYKLSYRREIAVNLYYL